MLESLLLFASASFAEESQVKNKIVVGSLVGKTKKVIITVCDGTGLGS